MKLKRLFPVFVFGLGLTLALLGLLGTTPDVADASSDVLYVAPDCSGISNCYTSIQTAANAAHDGDTIRVAQNTYYETVVLTKSVTLEGGWNGDFTARDWDVYVTTIDAQRNGSVIQVRDNVSPTIEGFTLTGGDASAFLGWGGGILVYGNWGGSGMAVIRHNVITDNVACRGATCQGYGGGILVYSSKSTIEYNTVISNAARIHGSGSGTGGGIAIWGTPNNSTIAHNVILNNTAAYTPTSPASGRGGGVYIYSSGGILTDNEIRGNVAAVDGVGRGGGVYAGGALYNNRILNNTASVNGAGYGGGVYALYVTNFADNTVQGNVASQNGDGTGGGVWAQYLKQAQHNTIVDNVATRGGGIYYTPYLGHLALRDNLIARNRATGTSTASPPDGGGGIASYADKVTILDNTIVSNTATSGGGGVLINQGTQYVLRGNTIATNTALAGGGINVYSATGTIESNRIISNTSVWGGGMYLFGAAQPTLDGNIVMSNTAVGFWGAAGGGIMVAVDANAPLTLTNHIIARNVAGSGGPGGGVLCWQGDCVLLNNTIVDNDRGDYDESIILGNSGYAGTYTLINNIIVGHSTGVWLVNGTATLDYNDYYDNGADVSGATWGTHHRTDAPQFEDRTAGDYHLALTSPLIDQGDSNVAPNHDYEGDSRPIGPGFDIGADEVWLRVFLPLVLRNS